MALAYWRMWLRSLLSRERRQSNRTGRTARSARSRTRCPRPLLEELEARLAPATSTWTGGGIATLNFNWSNPANWSTSSPGGIPADGDDLVFPDTAPDLSRVNINDLDHDADPMLFVPYTFNSITISGSDGALYQLNGNQIRLGTAAGSGQLIDNSSLPGPGFPSSPGNDIKFDIILGGAAGNRQFFTVQNPLGLTLSGKLTGTTGVELTKDGSGLLIFTNDNSGFTGPIVVDQGILQITHALALGDFSASPPPPDQIDPRGTTVHTNAQLQLSNVASPILETLRLSGPGVSSLGALYNVAGNTTWAGRVTLDSETTLGAQTLTALNITGAIGDLGTGFGITKEGSGQILFSSANTYRGLTTINDGRLTVRHPQGLGANNTPESGTLVNDTLTSEGTLQIEDTTGVGFLIHNEHLTLNGPGFNQPVIGRLGAISNLNGNNTWSGPVFLGSAVPNGSNVSVGAELQSGVPTTLTISGVVSDPNQIVTLTKIRPGRISFNNRNTYRGATTVAAGFLNIRDSQAMGLLGAGGALTTVNNGGTLELEVDTGFDANGRDLGIDSVTGVADRLTIDEALTINGLGSLNTGALRSLSGINNWTAPITLGSSAAIGVEPDGRSGHALPSNDYFALDYSLTVGGVIQDGSANTPDTTTNPYPTFTKRGNGHLILPRANTYRGITAIQEGWVTVQNDLALGGEIPLWPDTLQGGTTVSAGAALHLKPLVTDSSFTITFQGALGNQGRNTMTAVGTTLTGTLPTVTVLPQTDGDASGINDTQLVRFGGTVTGGNFSLIFDVDGPGPNTPPVTIGPISWSPSILTLMANTQAALNTVFGVGNTLVATTTSLALAENLTLSGTGITHPFALLNQKGALVNIGGSNSVGSRADRMSDIRLTGIAGIGVEQVDARNEGHFTPSFPSELSINASIYETAAGGGITKLGSRRLNLQGDGTYTGAVSISEGVLRAQHDRAFGASGGGVTVQHGAALELADGIAATNGGIRGGIEVWGETLTLNGAGNTLFGDAPLTILSNDHMWRGPVSLNTVGHTFTITFQNALGNLDITAPLTADGAGLVGLNQTVGVLTPDTVNGGGGFNEVRTLQFGGRVSAGTFTLTFNGTELTGPITWDANATTLAANIQAALFLLPSIGNNNVKVSPTTPTVDVRFGSRVNLFGAIDDAGSFATAGSDLIKGGLGELALAGSSTYRGTTHVLQGFVTVENGTALGSTTGGTVVANGATLQLQGDITVAGEPLTVQGNGVGSVPTNFPVNWFSTGPNPITNGETIGNENVAGRVTGVAADPRDANIIYLTAGTGGAWKTEDGGATWRPLIDNATDAAARSFTVTFQNALGASNQAPLTANGAGLIGTTPGVTVNPTTDGNSATGLNEVQTIVFTGTITGGTFTLTFGSATTGLIAWNPDPVILVRNIQTALDQLSTVATSSGGPNTVVEIPPISLQGLFMGSIAIAPTDPTTLYIGTGEANGSVDSFYGRGVLKSTDSGRTWTLIQGNAVTQAIQITYIGTLAAADQPQITANAAGLIGTSPTITTSTTAIGGTGRNEVQRLTFTGGITGGTFTLTFNLVSTGAITWDPNPTVLATNIQNALIALATVGAGNSTTVALAATGAEWDRHTITKMVVDPLNANRLYLAVNGNGANGLTGQAGIWRLDTPTTVTGIPVAVNLSLGAPPLDQTGNDGTVVPTGTMQYTDLAVVIDPAPLPTATSPRVIAYAVGNLGSSIFNPATVPLPINNNPNAVYTSLDSGATWNLYGFPVTDPHPNIANNVISHAGAIKLTMTVSPRGQYLPDVIRINIDALVSWPIGHPSGAAGTFREIRNLAIDYLYAPTNANRPTMVPILPWGTLNAPPSANFLGSQALYNSVILTDYNPLVVRNVSGGYVGLGPVGPTPNFAFNLTGAALTQHMVGSGNADFIYIAGVSNPSQSLGATTGPWISRDRGATWTDASVGVPTAPHASAHAMTLDFGTGTTPGRLLLGTDGGLWRLQNPNPGSISWTNLNGNIGITQFNGIAAHPSNPSIALGGSRSNGTVRFNANQAWTRIDGGDGSDVVFDPSNPNVAYHVQNGELGQNNGVVRKTTNALSATPTWVTLGTIAANFGLYTPPLLALDSINPARLVVGGGTRQNDNAEITLQETLNGGTTWFDLSVNLHGLQTPIPPAPNPIIDWYTVTALGISTFQGPFVADSGFSLVTDKGANTYDDDTIYVVTKNQQGGGTERVFVTKDHGLSWQNRTTSNNQRVTVTFQGTKAGADQLPLTANTTNLTGTNPTIRIGTRTNGSSVMPTVDEIQTITFYGNITGGTFTLTFNGVESSPITWSAIPATLVANIQSALDGLVPIGAGNSLVASESVTLPLGTTNSISDIVVDPRNRDHVYVVRNVFDALGQKVFESTDAGQTWRDISAGLPNLPAWGLVIDPRYDDLYLGTDNGVWKLTGGAGTWQRMGVAPGLSNSFLAGLPQVQVRELELNQTLNILTIGTYGRGAYQLFLPDLQANSGALRSLSGTAVWTGSVTLAGNTTVSAGGTQVLQNGLSTAQLTIVGTVRDDPSLTAPFPTLTKIGQGDVILSGANTYGGLTQINQGVLVVRNALALGSSAATAGTVVTAGTALELESNVNLEPLTLNGDGFLFNGHFTGALRSVTNANTYTGPITLATNTTIGVDSGSQLTITGRIDDGLGTPFTLSKELTGLLVLNPLDTSVMPAVPAANVYRGTTFINQGPLQIRSGQALGTAAGGTVVLDGGQLQLQGTFDVTGEALSLTGGGIVGTGALLNTGGDNKWLGTVLLDVRRGFLPETLPRGVVAVGVTTSTDSLTIGGSISETIPTGLSKVGLGKLVLSASNTYNGTTYVNAGILNVQHDQALGGIGTNEVQRVSLGGNTAGTFTLTFNHRENPADANKPTETAPQSPPFPTATFAFNALAATIQAGLESVLSIDPGDVSVARAGNDITITFAGQYAGENMKLLAGNSTNGVTILVSTVADGGIGTQVNSGTELQVQHPTGGSLNIAGEALRLNGDGGVGVSFPLTAGVLHNVAGTNTWTGSVTLADDSTINTDASSSLTISGVVSEDALLYTSVFPTLTKIGTGTLVLSNANTYRGETLVQAGILNIRNPLALGAAGGARTVVSDGATLQLQGGFTFSAESLQITGSGFNPGTGPLGALHNVANDNTWSGALSLNGDSAVGAESSTTLTLTIGITDVVVSKLTKLGLGTVVFNGATANTYRGLTQVNAGTLQVDKTGGALAIPANLTVGDGAAPSALLQFLSNDNQLQSTATVIVNNDGTFDLNNRTQTLGLLQILDGIASTGLGALGVLTLTPIMPLLIALDMVGGTFTLGNAPTSQLVLNGNVTAASSAVGLALIQGTGATPGVLSLNGADRTFTVGDGPNANTTDLRVTAPIVGTAAEGLLKNGAGLMEIDSAANAYTGTTTIDAGTLQVDGIITSNVSLNGGTLAGTGTVNNIISTATGGTVAPGNSPGLLTAAGTVIWNAATTFNVEIGGLVAGTNYDVLNVTAPAAINLAGANLTGSVVNPMAFTPTTDGTQSFTIINAPGGVTGMFAQGNTVFLSGMKFSISYLPLVTPTTVVLTRLQANTTTVVSSSSPTSTFGQTPSVTFTATVTPEMGATFNAPPTGVVTFRDNGVFMGTGTLSNIAGVATATYTTTVDQLTGGIHSNITAVYDLDEVPNMGTDDDVNFFGSTSTAIIQTVNQAPTTTTITSVSPPMPGGSTFGQTVTFTVQVTRQSGTGPTAPIGVVRLYDDNGGTLTLLDSQSLTDLGGSSGISQVVFSLMDDTLKGGTRTIRAVYDEDEGALFSGTDDDFNFLSSTSPDVSYTVAQRGTITTITQPLTGSSSTFGDVVTFKATVTPPAPFGNAIGTTRPTGFVTFLMDGSPLGTPQFLVVDAGVATATLVTTPTDLVGGTHTITAVYDRDEGTLDDDTNFLGSTSSGITFTVNQRGTTATITEVSPTTSSTYDQRVTIKAAVAPNPALPGVLPQGRVFFFDNGNPVAIGSALLDGTGVATFTTDFAQLNAGSHSFVAVYDVDEVQFNASFDDDFNFAESPPSTAVAHTVNQAPTVTTVTASPGATTGQFGNSVRFTATVTPILSPLAGGTVAAVGTVRFYDGPGGTFLGSDVLTPADNGVAFIDTGLTQLAVGSYNIVAFYDEDEIQFTASDDDTNFAGSSGTLPYTITQRSTTTTILSVTPGPTSFYDQQVIIKAKVEPTVGSTVLPVGVVTFFDNGTPIGTASLADDGFGVATATFTTDFAQLNAGSHSFVAVYDNDEIQGTLTDDDGNFAKSPPSTAVPHTVNQAVTTTTVTASPVTSTQFGNSVQFFATVTPFIMPLAGGIVRATGFVNFYDDSTSTFLGQRSLVNGVATYVTGLTDLAVSAHNIRAVYDEDEIQFTATDDNTNFAGSSGTLSYTITQRDTMTSIVSVTPGPTSFYDQAITIKAEVRDAVNGILPQGRVFFFDGGPTGTLLGTDLLDNVAGVATAEFVVNAGVLNAGPHSFVAVYDNDEVQFTGTDDDVNFAKSTSTAVPHTVNQASTTTTTISTAPPSPSVFGQSVRFTAQVGPMVSGVAPFGFVWFFDGGTSGTLLGTKQLDASGTAAFDVPSFLTGGVHNIVAVYDFDEATADDDANFASSSAMFSYTVNPAGTTTEIRTVSPAMPPGSNFGDPVTFTARVSSAVVGVLPQGVVTFRVGSATGTILGTGNISTLSGESIATFMTSTPLIGGDYNIIAVYDDDEGAPFSATDDDFNFSRSISNPFAYTVNPLATTTTITSQIPPSPTTFDQQITFTAQVTYSPLVGSVVPTGSVTFFDNGTPLGSGTLQNILGVATASFTTLPGQLGVGLHTNIRAIYDADEVRFAVSDDDYSFSSSTSAAVSHTVNQAPTTTSITQAVPASPPGSTFDQAVTFRVTVTPTVGSTVPTGVVTFRDGGPLGAILGTATLGNVGNVATADFPVSAGVLSVGNHTIVAIYDLDEGTADDDARFASSTSANFSYTVSQAPTLTTVTAALPVGASTFGQQVTFTATVTTTSGSPVVGASTRPIGVVTFFDGANFLGTGALSNVGGFSTATFTTSAFQLPTGARSITAVYDLDESTLDDDGNFRTSTSAVFNYTVNQAPTTTTVTSAVPATPSVFGQQVTFTATVTSAIVGFLPVGQVSFRTGTTVLGQGMLQNVGGVSTATFTTSPTQLLGGNNAITAVYDLDEVQFTAADDDLTFAKSTSSTFGYNVNRAATTTTITTAAPTSPSVFGQAVTFTATVTSAVGGVLPTGTVTFLDNGNPMVGTAATLFNSGGIATATFTTTSDELTGGNHIITAVYQPDVADLNYDTSTSGGFSYDVVSRATTTAITGASPPSGTTFGTQVTFTATVTPTIGGILPTGSVTFMDGTTVLGPGILQNIGGVATASFTTGATQLGAGLRQIQAIYNPGFDPNFETSTSAVRNHIVNQVGTTTATTTTLANAVFGQALVRATVLANIAAANPVSGTVTFGINNGTTVTNVTITLVGGVATLTPPLDVGNYLITATYNEASSPNYGGSVAPGQLAQIVNRAGSATVLTATSLTGMTNAFFNGEPLVLTAVIGAALPGAGTPNGGTVSFFDNGTLLGTAPVVGGVATFTAARLGSGTHNFRADFSGNGNFLNSSGLGTATNLGAAITVTATRVKGRPQLRVINQDGSMRFQSFPFETSYRGSIRLATGDMNGDGFPDVVVVSVTRSQRLVIYDGRTGARLQVIRLGRLSTDRAVFAAAGDIDGNGRAEIIVGLGGVLRGYNGLTGQRLFSFRPFGRTSRKTMRVVALDVNNDGVDEIFALLGSPGNPQVKGYDGRTYAELPASVYAHALPTIIARSNQ